MNKIIFALLLCSSTAFATTQAVKQDRLRAALTKRGMPSSQASLFLAGVANVFYYDTYAELAAATPTEGTFGWAIDTNAMYYYTGAAWTAVLSASSVGLLGTNSGTIGNETNNVWALAENSENLTLTYADNLVTLGSGTSATIAFTPAVSFTGDASFVGGAGAITVSGSGASTLVAADADSTAFCMGAAGALDLVCLDTTDASPSWDVKGVIGQVSLHVDAGTLLVDETAEITGDLTLTGGAGALTVSGSGASTLVAADADSTAFCMGATGALDLVCLDTTDASPSWDVKGVIGQTALHVDAGTALVDEDLAIGGGVGALNVSASGDSTLVATDADSTAFCMGATGALDLVCLDTTDASPSWDIKGVATQTALHVDVGNALIDEDLSVGGGVGALNVSASGDATLVALDADSTAFCMGAAGALDLVCLDTTDASPSWDVKGVVGQVSLHVDAGTLLVDETAAITGDLSPNGGAGAITVSASGDSTLVAADADSTAFCMGAAGALDLVCLDTTDASPSWDVKGVATQVSLHVDAGTVLVDEDVSIGGGAGALTFTDSASSIVLPDGDATALLIGSTDQLDLITINTSNNAELVAITGTTSTTAFQVAVGESIFTEGVDAAVPAMALHEIRFCGNAANGNTAKYMGPILEADMDTDMTFGAAGCDGNDDDTVTNVDDAPIPFAYKPVAMTCFLAIGGTNDSVAFQLIDDTAAVTGMTCSVVVDGAAAKQCTVRDASPQTVAAGSLVAVRSLATDDNLSAVDGECRVFVTF